MEKRAGGRKSVWERAILDAGWMAAKIGGVSFSSFWEIEMKAGTTIRTTVLIQSDDRENGIEDGSPVFPAGTVGTVVGLSAEHLAKGAELKIGCADSVMVDFGSYYYDLQPGEFEVV